ncbi:MAG: glycosyltransferase family 4 protein [Polyangiaceae bacterium]|jgi:glycosyltransferase involved in cell wall biosynthesis
MTARKRLLFLTDVFPFPLDRGQRVRVRHLLAACARVFDVTFVGPAPADEHDRELIAPYCAGARYVSPIPETERLTFLRAMAGARRLPGLPRRRTIRQFEPFLAALREAGAGAFDYVWVERPHMARLCAHLCSRTILDLDDIEHVKLARKIRVDRSLRQRIHDSYRYLFFRQLELSWSKQFLATVVCSDEDLRYLIHHGCDNAIVVPNGVNLVASPDGPLGGPPARRPGQSQGLRVLFLGNVQSDPNLDAIYFFVHEVLPRLRARAPDVSFDVIGANVTPEVKQKFGSSVCFRGFVHDLTSAMAEYDVLAAPLRFGGGTKLKVLDAMAHGLPVVTTRVGAEGLSLRHEEHVLIVESADDCAEAILRIRRDCAFADRLAAKSYALVRDHFSWDSIEERLAEWLRRLEDGDGNVGHTNSVRGGVMPP